MRPGLSLRTIYCFLLAAGLAGCGADAPSSTGGTGGAGTGGAGTGGAGTGGAGTGGAGTGGAGTGGAGTGGAGTGGASVDAAADQGSMTDASGGDAAPGAFQFKSAGLVMMGADLVFPPRHSAPMNVSPPFSWGTGPAGTMSYAITMFDMSIGNPHFAMWDIPASETGLPANIPHTAMPGAPAPAGMRQTANGFQGPGGPNVNMYELRLWALKVPMLPNPGTNAGAIRTRLLTDLMGAKTLVLESQVIIAKGTRGGIGTDPQP
ncbi:MAG TPA: hypothetical protein VFH73_28135 [Polyangia bacterium]|jgi:phosphatidylethanolamine-binding protein (PEBP) family uncharacterized protein|nr:hypothetical protein [Polyangia bacterium]